MTISTGSARRAVPPEHPAGPASRGLWAVALLAALSWGTRAGSETVTGVESAATTASAAVSAPPPRPSAGRQGRGPVTNLPLPRFVSLKSDEGNARRGPSLAHRIDWVYTRRAMPLEVTAEFGHWRRVRDRDGAGGWVHYALLSGVRTVLVEQDMVSLRQQPRGDARILAHAEAGVVARLGACRLDWCRISAGGQRGWVEKAALWGVGVDEIRE
ncbi:MAG: SH3 domain-containing protein [Pseudomonadota bacterium]